MSTISATIKELEANIARTEKQLAPRSSSHR
jgi:hypothetical protein